jgi:peptide/nickel transport system permease protein
MEMHGLSVLRRPWLRLRRRKATLVASVIVLLVAVLGIAGDKLAPYSATEQFAGNLERPTLAHPAGTDELGRDVFSRVIDGSRPSVRVGFVAVVVAIACGVPIGLLAGYYGRAVDTLLMRSMDAVMAFPAILLALLVAAVLGQSLLNLTIAVGLVFTPSFARLVHGQVLSVREREFVASARVTGAGHLRIMVRHILPNVLGPVIVQASLVLGWAILIEASLSFLGLGVQPPTPSWGSMLRAGYSFLELQPWLATAPGIAITVTVLALNLLGDGLRTWLDPTQRSL